MHGLLLCSNVVREIITTSTAAFFAQLWLNSTRRLKKSGQFSVSRRAYRNRHGCPLEPDGAHFAASNKPSNSLSVMGSLESARGDQRSRKSLSIACSGFRTSLAFIFTVAIIAVSWLKV